MKYFSLKLMLGIAIILALGLASMYLFLFSSLSKMKESRAAFAIDIKDSGKILAQENSNAVVLSGYFVKDGGEAAFISSIESLCKDLSIACTISSLNESGASDSVKVFHLTVSSLGQFDKVMALLQSFERSPYPLLIPKAGLSFKGRNLEASSSIAQWQGVFDIEVPVLIGTK